MTDKDKKTQNRLKDKAGKAQADQQGAPVTIDLSNVQDERSWIRKQAGKASGNIQATAYRFFITDEDLPLSRHILLFSIAAFVVIFIIWANFATLDEVTRGEGRIIPSTEVQTLQTLEGGIIEEFLVRDGDRVVEGQVMIRLRAIDAAADLGATQARYLGLLAAIARLEAEVQGKPAPEFPEEVMQGAPRAVSEEMAAFRANRERREGQLSVLRQQTSQRQTELQEVNTRIRDTRELIRIAREERDMIAPLVERGSAPRLELLQLDRQMQERQTELNSLESSVPRIRSAIGEAQARINEMTTATRAEAQTELAAKQIEMAALAESLASLTDRRERTEIRSPVTGTVKDIKVRTVGGVVRPGFDLIEIVPDDEQLLVEAQIRPSDIAFLYPGQPAIIKITAYDYSIYGGLNGEVAEISADSITNEQGESFYRVRVRTNENEIRRRGEILPIIPGMVASVDILTGKKTVMEYIIKPFIKTLSESMNER